MEILHVSSLIHDDIIDKSDTRRKRQSIHQDVGKLNAIFGSNFMIARASFLCASTNQIELVELLSLIMENLVKGEIISQN